MEKEVNQTTIAMSYCIIGIEYNDLWNCAELYVGEGNDMLVTTDEWGKARIFDDMEQAEHRKQYLQKNYDDYGWYILKLNDK